MIKHLKWQPHQTKCSSYMYTPVRGEPIVSIRHQGWFLGDQNTCCQIFGDTCNIKLHRKVSGGGNSSQYFLQRLKDMPAETLLDHMNTMRMQLTTNFANVITNNENITRYKNSTNCCVFTYLVPWLLNPTPLGTPLSNPAATRTSSIMLLPKHKNVNHTTVNHNVTTRKLKLCYQSNRKCDRQIEKRSNHSTFGC